MAPAKKAKGSRGNNGQTDTAAPPERNERIIAIRKEKSRDAARSRRGKENYEFYELAKMLPLPGAITSQLDKASIIRLTISYLRMRDFATQGDPPWNVIREIPPNTSVLQKDFKMPRRRSASVIATEVFEHHLGSHLLQSLDGFLFALTSDGRFLYVSETVSIYLGLSQVELTGSSVFDYVHPADHAELAEQLGMKLPPKTTTTSTTTTEASSGSGSSSAASTPTVSSPHTPQQGMTMTMSADPRYERGFFLRMKSTLTKRGVHIKSSGYKVVQISGRLRPRMILTHTQRQPITIIGFVALAHSLPSPNINEIRMECEMFVSKANLDMKISFCEPRINHFMDLTPSDVLGKSVYDFLHAEDVAEMRTSHFDLLNKGQVVTKYFRWMTKTGGYVWIQTSATITATKNTNERLVVCINYILSQVEYKNCVMDISQLPNRPTDETSESSNTSESEADSSSDSDEDADGRESSNDSDDSGNRDHSSKRRNHSTQNKHTTRKGKKRAKGPGGKGAKKQKYEERQNRVVMETKVAPVSQRAQLVNSEVIKKNDVKLETKEKTNSTGAQQPSERTDVVSEESIKKRGRPRKRKIIQHVNSCESRESSTGAGHSDVAPPPPHIDGAKTSPNIPNDQTPCIPSPQFDSGLGVKSERQEAAADFQLESWDNPPNREITREQATLLDTPDSPFTRNQILHRSINQSPVSQSPMSIHDIPKSPFQKTSSISSPSTGVPESVLTPPATETTKSGFVLPPVSSLTPSVISIAHNDSQHAVNPPPTLSPMETGKESQSSETVTSISAIASAHASLLANLTPHAAKESVINIHPHVLTTDSVTTAYAGMPYASYDKYAYSPYGTAMNLATHAAAYQGNHYGHMSPYGNYTQSQETPMDLTYGSGYSSHMQIVRPEILQNVAKQQYLSGAKSPYAAFTDAHDQLSKLHSKSNSDLSSGGQQKV